MAYNTGISAGIYTNLGMSLGPVPTEINEETLKDCFATQVQTTTTTMTQGNFVLIPAIREFPAIGIPPNVVNVPIFGQPTSAQVQGQSDLPSMEITINYIASEFAANALGKFIGDSVLRVFRVAILSSEPTGTEFATKYASTDTATSIASVPNSQYFCVGKLDALMVTPQLTDADQATLTMTIQGTWYGAYTNSAGTP